MVLLRESKKEEDINHTINDPVILVEGTAGVGKTTSPQKKKTMLSDWISGQRTMHILPSYDLLHAECQQ